MRKRNQFSFREYEISPVTLRFNPQKELEFQQYYYALFGKQSKVVLSVAAVLVILFGIGDFTFSASYRTTMFYIRYAVVSPLLLLVSILVWFDRFEGRLQILLAVGLLCGFVPLNIVILLLPPGVGQRYTMALLLMIMFAYNLSRMQFIYAAVTAAVLLPFSIVVAFLKSVTITSAGMYNLYIIGGFGIGLATCYLLEYSTRKSFHFQSKLEDLSEKQEQTISDRTSELEIEKDSLQTALEERNAINAELHHQIKNQMQVLSSLIRMLHETGDKENFERYVNVLAHLFEYAAPDAAKQAVDISDLMKETIRLYCYEENISIQLNETQGASFSAPVRTCVLVALTSFVILDCAAPSCSNSTKIDLLHSGQACGSIAFHTAEQFSLEALRSSPILTLLVELCEGELAVAEGKEILFTVYSSHLSEIFTSQS